MLPSDNAKTEDLAARALELLEQAYSYYNLPLRAVNTSASETYYEYVKAA
ncbi:MAG: hypothetical protein ACU0BK_17840 [Shimia sp.]|jgi:hypothetical protein